MKAPLIVSLLALAGIAAASFTVDWSTMDAGGGTSRGGTIAISGSIGQTDTVVMSGGNYTVSGGFWAMPELIQTPGGPALRIFTDSASGHVVVAWPAPSTGWVLQSSAALAGWTTVTASPIVVSGENRITFTDLSGKGFFRLARP